MFEDIVNYMQLSLKDRQQHLKLEDNCIEIGGLNSTYYKGLLAHYLKTTIPTRITDIQLCHACGNGKCSNPNHLYWGTYKENVNDSKLHGTFKILRDSTIKKYGIDEANKIFKAASSKGGKSGGGSNKLSEEEIKNRMNLISDIDFNLYGWVKKVSEKLNISHTHAKRFIKKYKDNYYSRV